MQFERGVRTTSSSEVLLLQLLLLPPPPPPTPSLSSSFSSSPSSSPSSPLPLLVLFLLLRDLEFAQGDCDGVVLSELWMSKFSWRGSFWGGRSGRGNVGPRVPEQSPAMGCGIQKDACDMWESGA
eukprot:7858992-Pyramimonas_sp.AAC.1